ncbi:MAG: selenide, water dikinase SelD [Planctomycetales bacterium]|nr:selenide, water dikinase SelD [Planctomycetales bacterium]
MQSTLPQHDIVLLGVGHTNAHVLRMWKMGPLPGARLTCVSNYPTATYSGMLPGVLAGLYPPERMEIDLVRLCAAAGARLIVGDVTGLDVNERQLLIADRPPLPFNVLSIGLGSVPNRTGLLQADDSLLEVKPMQSFLRRLEERLRLLASGGREPPNTSAQSNPLRITIVGGGAGGAEIAFCLPMRVRKTLGDTSVTITLIDSGDTMLKGSSAGLAKRVKRDFDRRDVKVLLGRRVTHVMQGAATLDNGDVIPGDLVLWVTSASPPPLIKDFDLPKDDRGFLLTRNTLQSTSGELIFAVGDTGTIEGEKLPKAGVYAVREGPVLWENMQLCLEKSPLMSYRPQRGFLKLLNRGDGTAFGEYRGFSFEGSWAWRLKDRIDGKFMDMYQDYSPGMPADATEPEKTSREQMRCAGCGGKVGASILSRALARLDIPQNEHVLLGLDAPDDVAILQPSAGKVISATVDFFQAPLDDPYLAGRMAALHAASDVLAKGAKPFAALAMATLPPGPEKKQEQLLYELLAGGLHEFRAMGATLAGGHTIEGPNVTIGYTILAEQPSESVRTKGKLREGDVLILTKPLGVGVLLAAHMQARCKAEWYGPLVETMLQSNAPAAALFDEFGVAAATDITGFGLAGHLLEMLRPANLAAELRLETVPILNGVRELLDQRLESTLAPANRQVEAEMEVGEQLRQQSTFAALFDPQTCGGILLGIEASKAEGLLARLSEANVIASIVGRVVKSNPSSPRLKIV